VTQIGVRLIYIHPRSHSVTENSFNRRPRLLKAEFRCQCPEHAELLIAALGYGLTMTSKVRRAAALRILICFLQ